MTKQKLESISKKISDGSATLKERLTFAKEMNLSIEKLRKEIKKIKGKK